MFGNRGLLTADGLLLALQLVTLIAVTRTGRGSAVLASVGYAALYGLWTWGGVALGLDLSEALRLTACVMLVPFTALVVALSRGDAARQLFVALDYQICLAATLPFAHLLLFRASSPWGLPAACAVVVAVHVLFLGVLLSRVPRTEKTFRWREPCAAAALLLLLLYATGVWPLSPATGGGRELAVFAVTGFAAGASLPLLYASVGFQMRTLGACRALERLSADVAVRREAIDAARRQRHDQRHHRIVLAEYLLRGQVDRALAYLEQLDAEAGATLTDRLVWCENDTINAILSGSARKAAAKGVRLEVAASVDRTVAVPDVDLVALVANLIENAVNASADGDTVAVTLRQRERTVGMTVTNRVPSGFALTADGLPGARTGVGLESVRRIVARHRGELAYTLADGRLTCRAMLRTDGGDVS